MIFNVMSKKELPLGGSQVVFVECLIGVFDGINLLEVEKYG